jgi:hypothetical protein
MTVTSDLDAWWAELKDYDESNAAKAKFQELMIAFEQSLDELQQMNADGEFDKLPASWKAKALWAWQQFDNARDTVKADAEFMEGLNWRP